MINALKVQHHTLLEGTTYKQGEKLQMASVTQQQQKQTNKKKRTKKLRRFKSASELHGPTERPPLVGEVIANFSG
jgi:hypothetical protein